jgi:6-phosphofructokinase 1
MPTPARKIAVLTSGGDAPGMNAAVRAVVRCGIGCGWEVAGVRNGYAGLIAGDFVPLDARAVGGIIQLGGTVLGSSRCPEFCEPGPRREALGHLAAAGISALVVIGGDGSQRGAHALSQMGFPVAGVASTIDNDLCGSEITIGVDTALNVALEAIDRLKITASSHRRAILVEVMGRRCGYLALMVGIAGGAEAVLIPELESGPEQLAEVIRAAYGRGKRHALVVVAEGCAMNAFRLEQHFAEHRERLGFGLRVTILGHVQRGGAPGAFDRLLATRLAAAAVEALAAGRHGVLAGQLHGAIVMTPLAEVTAGSKPLDLSLLDLASVLAS